MRPNFNDRNERSSLINSQIVKIYSPMLSFEIKANDPVISLTSQFKNIAQRSCILLTVGLIYAIMMVVDASFRSIVVLPFLPFWIASVYLSIHSVFAFSSLRSLDVVSADQYLILRAQTSIAKGSRFTSGDNLLLLRRLAGVEVFVLFANMLLLSSEVMAFVFLEANCLSLLISLCPVLVLGIVVEISVILNSACYWSQVISGALFWTCLFCLIFYFSDNSDLIGVSNSLDIFLAAIIAAICFEFQLFVSHVSLILRQTRNLFGASNVYLDKLQTYIASLVVFSSFFMLVSLSVILLKQFPSVVQLPYSEHIFWRFFPCILAIFGLFLFCLAIVNALECQVSEWIGTLCCPSQKCVMEYWLFVGNVKVQGIVEGDIKAHVRKFASLNDDYHTVDTANTDNFTVDVGKNDPADDEDEDDDLSIVARYQV